MPLLVILCAAALWSRAFVDKPRYASAMAVSSRGDVFVAGEERPRPSRVWVARLTPSGQLSWLRSLANDGGQDDTAQEVRATAASLVAREAQVPASESKGKLQP